MLPAHAFRGLDLSIRFTDHNSETVVTFLLVNPGSGVPSLFKLWTASCIPSRAGVLTPGDSCPHSYLAATLGDQSDYRVKTYSGTRARGVIELRHGL